MSDSGVWAWLSRLKSWQLFLAALLLFLGDVVIPDPIPFIDEALLGVMTLLLTRWKRRREPTPPSSGKRD